MKQTTKGDSYMTRPNKQKQKLWSALRVPRLHDTNTIHLAPKTKWQAQREFNCGMRGVVRDCLKNRMTVAQLRRLTRTLPNPHYAVQVVRCMAGRGLVTIR